MRLPTILLAAGAMLLLAAVAIGERMGSRVIGQATEQTLQSVTPQTVTPAPDASPQPYGPDWKRSQALSAAGDPHFPDPRVPPQPLPTPIPAPTAHPTPIPTPTPNPNIPIWRQQPFRTMSPAPTGPPPGSPAAQASPAASASPL